MYRVKPTIFIAVCLILSLTACGDNDVNYETSSPKSIAEALKTADQTGLIPSLNRDTTVAGPDVNNNYIRDDIEEYISGLSDSPQQKAALFQASSSITRAMLVDISDQNELTEVSRLIANSSACAYSVYDSDTAHRKILMIEELVVNTKERFRAYENFSIAISGTSFVLPHGDGCEK